MGKIDILLVKYKPKMGKIDILMVKTNNYGKNK